MERKLAAGKFFLAAVLMFALAFLVFGDTLGHGFFDRDKNLILENPSIKTLSVKSATGLFRGKDYLDFLPLRMLSYAIDYSWTGKNPRGYHLTNLILHSANGVIIYLIAVLLLSAVVPRGAWRARRRIAAAVCAALFVAHPVHVEPVAWIACRKEVLSSFFYLFGFYFFMRHRVKGEPVGFRSGYIISLVSFIAAMLSCPSAVNFIFAVALFDIVFPDTARKTVRRHRIQEYLVYLAAFGIVFTIYILFAIKLKMITGLYGGSVGAHIATVLGIAKFNIGKLLFPAGLSLVYDIRPGGFSGAAVSAAVVAAAILLFVLFLKRRPLMSFGIGWIFVALLPYMNIFPFNTAAADRFEYVAVFGIALLATGIGLWMAERGKAGKAMAGVLMFLLLGAYCRVSYGYASCWASETVLWERAVKIAPGTVRSRVGLGLAYLKTGKTNEAHREIIQALRIGPEDPDAYAGATRLFIDEKRYSDALLSAKKGLKFDSDRIELHYLTGLSYLGLGRYEQALKVFSAVRKVDPSYGDINFYMEKTTTELGKVVPYERFKEIIDGIK